MAFTNIVLQKRASDLVVAHLDHNFSNDDANITPPAAGAAIPFGTVVFRAKGLAKAAPWAAVSAAADVDAANEYAVVFGDGYGFKADFVPKAIVAGRYNAVVVKRDAGLKEYYIREVHATALGAAPYDILKQLMADQGLIVLDDDSELTI